MTAQAGPTAGTAVIAGVDIGGSKIAVLIADRDLAVRGRHIAPTEIGSEAGAIEQIADALDAALADAGATRADLVAIGVGVPGRVDPESGTVTLAVNLRWHDLALGPLLAERFGVTVALENDVRAAAAGLYERGVVGDGDLAYLSIGTGISAGVVLDGRLHRGSRGLAGEIGHVVVDATGPVCACGLRGCFEVLASGPAVARQVAEALANGRRSSLVDRPSIRATDVYDAAAAGDPLAVEVTETVGRHVAHAVHELVMTYDVRRVVLGGGVASSGSAFIEVIQRALDRLREVSELAREVLPMDVIRLVPGGGDAGAWGAVVLARSALDRSIDGLPVGDGEVSSTDDPANPWPAVPAEEGALRR